MMNSEREKERGEEEEEEEMGVFCENGNSKKVEGIIDDFFYWKMKNINRRNEGVLVYGTNGIGKSFTIKRVLDKKRINFVYVSLLSLQSSNCNKGIFQQIKRVFNVYNNNTVIFVDNLEKVKYSKEIVRLICKFFGENKGSLLISTTNDIGIIPKLLKRNGRFSNIIQFLPPSREERKCIIEDLIKQNCTENIKEVEDKIGTIVKKTSGFFFSDIISLLRETVLLCFQNDKENISVDDILSTLDKNVIKASVEKEESNMLNLIDDVNFIKWEDIGGLEDVKLKLRQCIEWPIIYKEKIKKLGILDSKGILMYGPPGCGKTALVKSLAHRVNFNFIFLNSANVYSPYLGESEKIITSSFNKARLSSPSIIFLDELDTIVGKRSYSKDSSSGIEQRILSTLLNEMDGIESLKNVIVVAATNRPDMIDNAILRQGRLDYVLYVPPPDKDSRLKILEIYTQKTILSEDVDLLYLVEKTEGFTGSDIELLCKESGMFCLRENGNKITMNHFHKALKIVHSSLRDEMMKTYTDFHTKSKN